MRGLIDEAAFAWKQIVVRAVAVELVTHRIAFAALEQ
jgi:hypothetical protein